MLTVKQIVAIFLAANIAFGQALPINIVPTTSTIPVISGTGPLGFVQFDESFTGGMGVGPYIDGIKLPYNCGMNNSTSQHFTVGYGYQIPAMNTACFPNGVRQLLVAYDISNINVFSGEPWVINRLFSGSVSGTNVTLPNHTLTTGSIISLSTTGTLPSPLNPGCSFFWGISGTNPSNVVSSFNVNGSGVMSITVSSTCGLAPGVPVFIRNVQYTSPQGVAVCDGWFTMATGSGTSFTINNPNCPSSVAANKNLEVIIYPYQVTYVDANTVQLASSPGGSPITLSGGSGTHTAKVRQRSPYWTGNPSIPGPVANGDFATWGGRANVAIKVDFENGAAAMQLAPPSLEPHGWTGKTGDTACPQMHNTDRSYTTIGCGSPITYGVTNEGGVTGTIITVNATTGAITYGSVYGWAAVTIDCATCAANGGPVPEITMHVHNHGANQAAVTYPHFTTCGQIATSFLTGTCHSYYPLAMYSFDATSGSAYQNAAVRSYYIPSMVHQARINTFMSGFPPGQGPGATPQSSCPSWTSSPHLNYMESIAQSLGASIDFDFSQVWFNSNNSGENEISELGAIDSNLQYDRKVCVTNLITHMAGLGIYSSGFEDDEFTNQIGPVLRPYPLIGGPTWTNAVVSGTQMTFNFTSTSFPQRPFTNFVQGSNGGDGEWVKVVSATAPCLNGWFPVISTTTTGTGLSVATTSIVTNNINSCANNTYEPSGGSTVETTAQMIISPSPYTKASGVNQQNVSGLPSAPGATQIGWTNTYYGDPIPGFVYASSGALVSIVWSGSSGTVNWTGHGLTSGQAIRLWNATNTNLNGVYPISSVTTNAFTITSTGMSNQSTPSTQTYNQSTDPNLIITVDPNWGADPLGIFYNLVTSVTGHPAMRWSALGAYYTGGAGGPFLYSWEGDPNHAQSSFVYNPDSPPQIYGYDTSVWEVAQNYAQPWGGTAARAWTLMPRYSLFASGYIGSAEWLCQSSTFNAVCDRPGALSWRPETLIAQMFGMKVQQIAALRGYNYISNMSDIFNLSCCGWSGGGTGQGEGMNPFNAPEEWAAMARAYTLLTLRYDTELQPEANKPNIDDKYFLTDAHLSPTYGNELQVLCTAESPYGLTTITLPAITNGSMVKYVLTGRTLYTTVLAGNPASDTDEYCSSPGKVTTYVALPPNPATNPIDPMTFSAPTSVPSGASQWLVQVGYYPGDMRFDPITNCTNGCTIITDHHNTSIYYRTAWADGNGLPRGGVWSDPIEVPSLGLY